MFVSQQKVSRVRIMNHQTDPRQPALESTMCEVCCSLSCVFDSRLDIHSTGVNDYTWCASNNLAFWKMFSARVLRLVTQNQCLENGKVEDDGRQTATATV